MLNNRLTTSMFALSVAVITFLVYIPALNNGFVNLDDDKYVYANPVIREINSDFIIWAFGFHVSNWHPLTWFSHAIDYAIWGLNPFGHHLTSNIIHSLNSVLVYLLCHQLLSAARNRNEEAGRLLSFGVVTSASAITALLFGLHPIHVESVAWVSERKDLLCAFFFLMTIIAYMHYINTERHSGLRGPAVHLNKYYLFTILLFIFALMSKPMAVTLPVVLLILDWHPLGRLRNGAVKKALMEKLPFFFLSAASSLLTIMAQRPTYLKSEELISVPVLSRIIVGFKAIFEYLIKMTWPRDLIPWYPYPLEASILSYEYYIPIMAVFAIAAACIISAREQRLWLAVFAYYFLTLLPVLGFVQVGGQAMADRYAYLPSIGPFLAAGIVCVVPFSGRFLQHILHRSFPSGMVIIIVSIFLASSFMTVQQIRIWKDDMVLWRRVVDVNRKEGGKKYRTLYLAYNNLGSAYMKEGDFENALLSFTDAISDYPGLSHSTKAYLFNNRGHAYSRIERYREALGDFTQAIILSRMNQTPYPTYYRNRAAIYRILGQNEAASEDLRRAELLGSLRKGEVGD